MRNSIGAQRSWYISSEGHSRNCLTVVNWYNGSWIIELEWHLSRRVRRENYATIAVQRKIKGLMFDGGGKVFLGHVRQCNFEWWFTCLHRLRGQVTASPKLRHMSGGGQGSKVLYDADRWWRVQSGAQKND